MLCSFRQCDNAVLLSEEKCNTAILLWLLHIEMLGCKAKTVEMRSLDASSSSRDLLLYAPEWSEKGRVRHRAGSRTLMTRSAVLRRALSSEKTSDKHAVLYCNIISSGGK